ncbi:MAG: hypothetical protein VX152_12055 [Pseudomonadota bacterium]|nr:hypothetical protein [Pseudomonadota bacterium]
MQAAFDQYDGAAEGSLSVGDAEAALRDVGVQLQPGQLITLLQQHGEGQAERSAQPHRATHDRPQELPCSRFY